MSRMKKLIIAAVSIVGSLAAAVSGFFVTSFVVGKKIDQAYAIKQNEENEENEEDSN